MQQLWVSKETKKKERIIKGRDLVDVVFSWSLRDVLNSNLYKGKVMYSSDSCLYLNTFFFLLLYGFCVLGY